MNGVVVLMGSYNGSLFADEQIASIHNQTITDVDIIISDDISSDNTLDILEAWRKKWTKGKFDIATGPCRGFSENFRSLIVGYSGSHDYVAFSDQDDIWDADKLEIAISWLKTQGDQPALYCGRTRYVDETGRFLRLSPHFKRPPQINNALVQCVAGGNTMVMNRKAMELVIIASRQGPFVSHDWWSYMIVSGCGGRVYYDSEPHVSYRQHRANIVGANDSLGQRWTRIRELSNGRLRRWIEMNLTGLSSMYGYLTVEAQQATDILRRLHSKNLLDRLSGLFNLTLFRQTRLDNLGLLVTIVLGKL